VCRGFLDNGAFVDWRAGREFDAATFARDLARVGAAPAPPDFIVAPDLVGRGVESLALSRFWHGAVALVGPVYLAVQDGMTEEDVEAELDARRWAGIFVGGTLPWKIRTGEAWCALARRRAIGCHIGRVGTADRIAWARRIGATSIDSCLPLWSKENLARFVAALETRQTTLGW
jgi:hypothetical protein